MAMYKVLSTKKLSPLLIEEAKRNGIEVTEQEAISIKPIYTKEKDDEVKPWVLKGDSTFVTFTSSNAVEAIKKYLHRGDTPYVPNWKVFSLSGGTKDALHAFTNPLPIIDTAQNAKDLAQKIIEYDIQELLFFCGNKRRDDLPDRLREKGIRVHQIVVYETIETPVVINEYFNAILFFSPSAVHSFFSLNQLSKGTVCFAVGATTADVIKGVTDNRVISSSAPSPETMLATIISYFQNINYHK